MEYITSFNEKFVNNRNSSMTEEMSRNLGILLSHTEMLRLPSRQQFIGASDELFESTNQLTVTTFYLNLYKFLSMPTKNGSLNTICQCLNIIDKGLKIEAQRQLILEQINFIPVLADLLLKLEKIGRPIVLELLLEITYNFRIKKHEWYLDNFISTLAELIQNESEYSELALRVLINVCFQNPICIYVLMRNVGCTEFLKSVKCHGGLASQMYIILHPESENDICLKASITELEKALSVWNVAQLRQTVNFIISIRPKSEVDVIECIFDIVRKRLDMDDGEDVRQSCEKGMVYIFDLFNCFLENANCPIEQVQQFAIEWINNETTIICAINTLRQIVDKSMKTDCSVILNNLPTEFVLQSDNIRLKSAFLKLVKALIETTKTFVLDDEALDRFVDKFEHEKITNNNIELFLYIAYIYFISSDLNPAKFYSQFSKLMNAPHTYSLFANAYNLKDQNFVKMLLALGQSKVFPVEQVSVAMSKTACCGVPCSSNIICPQLIETIPKDAEDKLDILVQRIAEAKCNDILDMEFIEIYQSKLELYRNKIELLQTTSEKELVGLRHENALLIAQTMQSESRELNLSLKLAEMQKENFSLKARVQTLQTAVTNFTNTIDKKKQKIADIYKTVEIKDVELAEYKQKEIKMLATIKETGKQNTDLNNKVVEFRNSLKRYEDVCKKKETEMDDLKSNNSNLNKKLADLEKEKMNLTNLMKEQEKQIILNEKKIQQYASEVEESEEMRKIIMEVMNKKQKKK